MGSDIEFICKRASILAIREFLSQSTEHRAQSTELKISRRHFEEAIKLGKEQLKGISKKDVRDV